MLGHKYLFTQLSIVNLNMAQRDIDMSIVELGAKNAGYAENHAENRDKGFASFYPTMKCHLTLTKYTLNNSFENTTKCIVLTRFKILAHAPFSISAQVHTNDSVTCTLY